MAKERKVGHPMQPLVWDGDVIRFKENAIVRRLVDANGHLAGGPKPGKSFADLNEIACWKGIPPEDFEQFWQMIGYSVSGYGDLSFIRRSVVNRADKKAHAMVMKKKRGGKS